MERHGLITLMAAWALLGSAPALAMPIGTYGWESATANAVLDDEGVVGDNNDNWINESGVGDGGGDFVLDTAQPVGFSGNYFSADTQDDLYRRVNDGAFSYAIPANAAEVVVSLVLTANASTFTIAGLGSPIGLMNFGNTNFGTWGVRDINSTIFEGAGTGAAALDMTTRSYRTTLTVDMTPAGSTKLASLVVENLTDGGSETIFTGLAYQTFADPSVLDGLVVRAFGAELDDISISATVPEPGTALLLVSGLVALAASRRARLRS